MSLTVAACSLLVASVAALWAKDLSPRSAFYKLLRKTVGIDLAPPRPLDEAPYSFSVPEPDRTPPAHRPILLNLPTYEGSGQGVHPDVVFIAEGFGAEGWTYWMAFTPYPYARERYENPSVLASHDGLNWVAPCRNPLALPPPPRVDHLSDTDLLLVDGRLRLYFRESINSVSPTENRLYVIDSADGASWSEPRLIMASTDWLNSPSVIRSAHGFVMWEISASVIYRRESQDGYVWSEPVATTVDGLREGQVPWHLDVTVAQGDAAKLHVLLNSVGVDGHRLHYGFSRDGGRTWTARPYLIERAYGFETAQHYRATMVPHPGAQGAHQMWYSARSEDLVWSIAYMHLRERGDDMIPAPVSPGVGLG